MLCRTFSSPEPTKKRSRILPVFIPFMGCPSRCVFCSQELQSGTSCRPLDAVLREAAASLENATTRAEQPLEIAFYGGTFTLLPLEDQLACLALAARYKKLGLVTKIRASTRPDAVPPALCRTLAAEGLDMLELGVQSFSDAALGASNRGYTGETARQGCETVQESGLELGIQLMPGMPGMDTLDFSRDWRTALTLAPRALRLYPCLVLANTPLAALYAAGEFTPWMLEDTVPQLADALLGAWRAGVPVIRMGLAPQDGLDDGGIVAGPHHPALGSMVRGLALFRYIKEVTADIAPLQTLRAPKNVQGEFWGHKGALVGAYESLGLQKNAVSFAEETAFIAEYQ
ncbi:MAG: hypothetical protein DELT_01260 [Desulfovibrio sp.]